MPLKKRCRTCRKHSIRKDRAHWMPSSGWRNGNRGNDGGIPPRTREGRTPCRQHQQHAAAFPSYFLSLAEVRVRFRHSRSASRQYLSKLTLSSRQTAGFDEVPDCVRMVTHGAGALPPISRPNRENRPAAQSSADLQIYNGIHIYGSDHGVPGIGKLTMSGMARHLRPACGDESALIGAGWRVGPAPSAQASGNGGFLRTSKPRIEAAHVPT